MLYGKAVERDFPRHRVREEPDLPERCCGRRRPQQPPPRPAPRAPVHGRAGRREQQRSGRRRCANTAALASSTDLVAFLDDDAVASPMWIEHMVLALEADPSAVGVGGTIIPDWERTRPGWLPEEFNWTVGGTFRAGGTDPAPVRNVWSGSMIVKTGPFQAAGGFRDGPGKVKGVAQPEDTETLSAHREPGERTLVCSCRARSSTTRRACRPRHLVLLRPALLGRRCRQGAACRARPGGRPAYWTRRPPSHGRPC